MGGAIGYRERDTGGDVGSRGEDTGRAIGYRGDTGAAVGPQEGGTGSAVRFRGEDKECSRACKRVEGFGRIDSTCAW